jgi:hypothetical protein
MIKTLEDGSQSLSMEGMVNHFEIRQKHPYSEELYSLRNQSVGGNRKAIGEFNEVADKMKHPFTKFNNREVKYKGSVIGRITSREGVFPQCIILHDNSNDCGYYFAFSIEIAAEVIDMTKALYLILDVIGRDNQIDYICVQVCTPWVLGGRAVADTHIIDPKSIE